tara:strand:- start:419 stop:748 length:330 start_codon:yes stop_codon:yes gene_type:complete
MNNIIKQRRRFATIILGILNGILLSLLITKVLKYHNNIRDVLIYFLGYMSGMFVITLIYRFLLIRTYQQQKVEDLTFEVLLYVIFSIIIGFLPISSKYLPKFVFEYKNS